MSQTIEIPYLGNGFDCPGCGTTVTPIAFVDIDGESVRNVGSNGFNKPNFNIEVKKKIKFFKIEHICADELS